MFKPLFTLALLFLVAGIRAASVDEPLPALDLKVAFPALKFTRPLWMVEAPDGSKRLFVVEQRGKVLILPKEKNGTEAQTFLDITDRKPYVQNEEGLLCLAFHPQFKTNGAFYIYYCQQSPKRTVLSEIHVSKTDPNVADIATERILMEIPQPYWNHKGSQVVFGPDGYLYFSLGDGGLGGDPHNVGQSGHHLLAKILRIDVDSRTG